MCIVATWAHSRFSSSQVAAQGDGSFPRAGRKWVVPLQKPLFAKRMKKPAFAAKSLNTDWQFCYCKTDLPPERINQFVAAVFAVQFTGQEKTGLSGTNASASGYRRRKLHVVSKKVN